MAAVANEYGLTAEVEEICRVGSSSPPEFFLDRRLGIRGRGGASETRLADSSRGRSFPDDPQSVEDDVWMEFDAPMFHLDNQHLKIAETARRFHNAQQQIYRKAATGSAACYAVSANGHSATLAVIGLLRAG
jgi:hypothetical protein